MKKPWLVLVCFLILVLGMVSLMLYLVGLQLSVFRWMNNTLGAWSILIYVGMIVMPAIIIYLSTIHTDIPDEVRS